MSEDSRPEPDSSHPRFPKARGSLWTCARRARAQIRAALVCPAALTDALGGSRRGELVAKCVDQGGDRA